MESQGQADANLARRYEGLVVEKHAEEGDSRPLHVFRDDISGEEYWLTTAARDESADRVLRGVIDLSERVGNHIAVEGEAVLGVDFMYRARVLD